MSYEVRTPVLVEAITASRAVIDGILNGKMEPREAAQINGATGRLVSAVTADVRARLARPRILAQEAKVVEADRSKSAPQALERQSDAA